MAHEMAHATVPVRSDELARLAQAGIRERLLDWPWIISWILRAVLIAALATFLRQA